MLLWNWSLKDDGQVAAFLKNLVVNYTTVLERNLDRRFQDAAPVLEAFSIFDPTCLPKPEDPAFKKYGVDEVKVLCKQFQFNKDHTLAQWYNFKYLMSSWKVPSAVLRGKDDLSPTEFTLRKVVKEQVAHRINFPQIVDAAQICLTQPMSNAVVERGASAVKRVKTRLRSRLKNDMMASLLHISLNGPDHDTEECKEMLVEATRVWRKTHFRNLPSLKSSQWLEDQTMKAVFTIQPQRLTLVYRWNFQMTFRPLDQPRKIAKYLWKLNLMLKSRL